MTKEEACGARAVAGAPGVKGMGGEDIKKFIKEHGTEAAKQALRGKAKSRGELCVILHSFRAGREKIAASGAMSNFRLTPSPNRGSSSSSNSNKSPPRFVAPVGMSKEQEKKFWSVVPKNFGKSSSPSNMRSNAERMLNNFMKSEQNRKALQNALSGNKPMKREKSYMLHGVKILGKRPTGAQIKAALMRKNTTVGKAGSSSSSSSSSNRRNGSSSNTGSSNKSANSLVSSKSGSSSSNRSNSNRSGGNNNSGGSNRGNGINRSHYQNLTAKRNKVVKVRQTESKRTGKKKNMSGPFCLLNPTNSACRKMSLRKNNFFRLRVGKGRGIKAPVRHGGMKTKSVTFMNVPNVGNKNVMNPTARIRPGPIGFHYTPGSRAKLTKNQLRVANNERWRRYANMTKNMVFNTKNVYGKLKPNTEAEQRSALANKLFMEVIKNIKAGKIIAAPPRRKLSKKRVRQNKENIEKMKNMKQTSMAKSELGQVFSKSYMTGHQLEQYYKPPKPKKEKVPKKKKKNQVSSSSSSSGSNNNSGSNSK